MPPLTCKALATLWTEGTRTSAKYLAMASCRSGNGILSTGKGEKAIMSYQRRHPVHLKYALPLPRDMPSFQGQRTSLSPQEQGFFFHKPSRSTQFLHSHPNLFHGELQRRILFRFGSAKVIPFFMHFLATLLSFFLFSSGGSPTSFASATSGFLGCPLLTFGEVQAQSLSSCHMLFQCFHRSMFSSSSKHFES